MSIIEGKKITKKYQIDLRTYVDAINGIDINIENGEFICIMGPSGSGKSTLLNILTTIDLPTKGKILIDQQNIRKFSENQLCKFRYRYLGFVFQDLNLLKDYSIYENISIPLTMAGVKKSKIKLKVEEVADRLGIMNLLYKKPSQCSGGQLQRVAIARALITDPRLIVADEPTGNLDANTTDEVLALFQKFYQAGNTIVMVSHDCYVASFASRVIYLKDGLLEGEVKRGSATQKEFFDQIVVMNAEELNK